MPAGTPAHGQKTQPTIVEMMESGRKQIKYETMHEKLPNGAVKKIPHWEIRADWAAVERMEVASATASLI